MNAEQFNKMTDSLRQYRRAELKDFVAEVGSDPVSELYVDPLPGDAILNTVLSNNTTFLLGRKGTGKSTVFAKAQSSIRNRRDLVSVYVDVKSLYDLASANDFVAAPNDFAIDPVVYHSHLLRKHFLGKVLNELILELKNACDAMSLLERWFGKKRGYQELSKSLERLADKVARAELQNQELPILQRINAKMRERHEKQQGERGQVSAATGATAKYNIGGPQGSLSASANLSSQEFSKSLDDRELYNDYSDVVLKSFPFAELLNEIIDLLDESGLSRVVAFFDDFSELEWNNQRLFVDVILSPLNNASNERIKLKVAGYPGRVYYGRIDPSKVDTVHLDFSQLYKSSEIQASESAAEEYTQRLLERRFGTFELNIADYFEESSVASLSEYYRLIFQATSNVPRLMGALLHTCYLDRVSRGQRITQASIRLAAEKYHRTVVSTYFDQANRYALEPFERKLDRHNQRQLLQTIVDQARDVRKRIQSRNIGGTYFDNISNPPVSHFAVRPQLEPMLASLELNYFVTKYADMRDKDGNDVSIYALGYGLCESERVPWGYPPGREYRNYFVQRCFDYNRAVQSFLEKTQTIRCPECGACHPMDKQDHFAFYNWRCNECNTGTCEIVQLAAEFQAEVEALDQAIMLEQVELDIINTLKDESKPMRAGEVSLLIDTTYQLVGKRTTKLQQLGIVDKSEVDGHMKSSVSDQALKVYFNSPNRFQ